MGFKKNNPGCGTNEDCGCNPLPPCISYTDTLVGGISSWDNITDPQGTFKAVPMPVPDHEPASWIIQVDIKFDLDNPAGILVEDSDGRRNVILLYPDDGATTWITNSGTQRMYYADACQFSPRGVWSTLKFTGVGGIYIDDYPAIGGLGDFGPAQFIGFTQSNLKRVGLLPNGFVEYRNLQVLESGGVCAEITPVHSDCHDHPAIIAGDDLVVDLSGFELDDSLCGTCADISVLTPVRLTTAQFPIFLWFDETAAESGCAFAYCKNLCDGFSCGSYLLVVAQRITAQSGDIFGRQHVWVVGVFFIYPTGGDCDASDLPFGGATVGAVYTQKCGDNQSPGAAAVDRADSDWQNKIDQHNSWTLGKLFEHNPANFPCEAISLPEEITLYRFGEAEPDTFWLDDCGISGLPICYLAEIVRCHCDFSEIQVIEVWLDTVVEAGSVLSLIDTDGSVFCAAVNSLEETEDCSDALTVISVFTDDDACTTCQDSFGACQDCASNADNYVSMVQLLFYLTVVDTNEDWLPACAGNCEALAKLYVLTNAQGFCDNYPPDNEGQWYHTGAGCFNATGGVHWGWFNIQWRLNFISPTQIDIEVDLRIYNEDRSIVIAGPAVYLGTATSCDDDFVLTLSTPLYNFAVQVVCDLPEMVNATLVTTEALCPSPPGSFAAAVMAAATASISAFQTSGTKTIICNAFIKGVTASISALGTSTGYNAAVGATLGAATAAASATFSAGTKTATIAASIKAMTASAAASFHTADVFTASVAASIAPVTASATAVYSSSVGVATVSAAIKGVTAAATATFLTHTYTATVSATIKATTASATAFYSSGVFIANVAATIKAVTAAATATYVSPNRTATITATVKITAAVSAQHVPPCNGCTAPPPSTVSLRFPVGALTDGSCNDCDTFNNSTIVCNPVPSPAGICRYTYPFCSGQGSVFQVDFFNSGGDLIVEVKLLDVTTQQIRWLAIGSGLGNTCASTDRECTLQSENPSNPKSCHTGGTSVFVTTNA